MVLAIVGSRGFDNYSLLEKEVKDLLHYNRISEIVSGGAAGADTLGEQFAIEHQLKMVKFLPQWSKYGNSAGFKRNKHIIDYADIIIAFHDGESKGTLSSIELAKKSNKPCYIIKYDN